MKTNEKDMSIQEFIEKIRIETGVPYLDVICYQEHKEIFRYLSGENTTGKEQLYMYSCSKPITVVSAMRLVEEGKLSLDDKVCTYLPDIKNAFILNEKGERVTVGEKMRIRHLFTMTAGFTYNLQTQPILQLIQDSQGKAVLQDFIKAFVQPPLAFSPGERFEYSLCHDVLAAVIEKVTKQKFSQYVKEAIFKPLDMPYSRFDNGESQMPDIYEVSSNGKVEKAKKEKRLIPTPHYESGGAGLVSTVEDYIAFADALACGGVGKNGYRVLGEAALETLTSKQIQGISVQNGFTCIQGEDYGYGLGVRVRYKPTSWGLEKGEFGWDGAAGSYVMIDPKKKVSVFIGLHLCNWPVVFTGKHLQIVEKIYKEFFNKQYAND